MDVLFVCLGNICRSPMAEAVFRHLVQARPESANWLIDSAGTGSWHLGSQPHEGTRAVLARHHIPCSHQARQVERADFHRFDLILAMDHANLAQLRELRPRHGTTAMRLLGHYDPQGESEVPDPYHEATGQAFQEVYDQVLRCCQAFLASIDAANRRGSVGT